MQNYSVCGIDNAIITKWILVIGSCIGVLSVVSRCSLGKIRQGIRKGKETAILTNSTFSVWEFLFFLFYVLRLFLRVGTPRAQYSKAIRGTSSSLVRPWLKARKEQGEENINKSAFLEKQRNYLLRRSTIGKWSE